MLGLHARPPFALLPSLAAAALLLAAPARADDLSITTREHGAWNEALAALRGDLGSEGRRIHVGVVSGSHRVRCDRYRLQLDAAAAQAFRVGGCDPGTGETLLVLEHRAALFDEAFHVPRPRTLSISAILRTTAVGGGGPQGGSLVHCSWAVKPYLDDLQHGTRVMLTPEHYALRSAVASVSTTPDRSGWTLHAFPKGADSAPPAPSAAFDLEYEVVDLATGDVVLRQKTTLRCGAEEPGRSAVAAAAPGRSDGTPAAGVVEPWLHEGARVYVHAYERWLPAEVVAVMPGPTFHVRYRSVYGLSLDDVVDRSRLKREIDPATDAGPAPVHPAPAEPAPASACPWGRGRKGRCNANPAIFATFASVMGLGATAAAIAALRAASHDRSGLYIPGTLATVAAVTWSGIGAALWVEYARAQPRVRPTVAASAQGAAVGLAGSF